MTSVVALLKILNAPSPAPKATVKTLLVISPAPKLELATVGCEALLGNSVRKPPADGTTVMLPVMAAAPGGIPVQTPCAGSVSVPPALMGAPGLTQPENPARVS